MSMLHKQGSSIDVLPEHVCGTLAFGQEAWESRQHTVSHGPYSAALSLRAMLHQRLDCTLHAEGYAVHLASLAMPWHSQLKSPVMDFC